MYTQCPECLTIYEIDEDALQASLGIVRCGRCDKRFDALRTLSDTLPTEPLAPLPEQDPAERAPTLTEAVPPSTIERAAKKRPAPRDAAGPAPTGSPASERSAEIAGTPPDENADDWFADIESELAASSQAGTPGHTAQEPDAATAWAVELPEEAGLTGSDVDATFAASAGDDRATQDGPDQPPLDEDAPWQETLALDAPAPSDPAPADDGLASDASLEPPEAAEPTGILASGLGAGAPDASVSTETTLADAGSDAVAPPAHVYIRPGRRFPRVGAMWTLGCALLALLLAVQLAWADRVKLFRNPSTHAWMARVCRSIPCSLPLIKDTAKLELLSRDVRPDPNAAGALTIMATLRNGAAFAQPWPVVVVELTDLDNDPVAMRRFRPAEYMPDPARRAAGIAPGATAAVAFEVADPGKRAVAFQFGFE